MKCSFVEDPACSTVVFDLLDVVFPGIREHAQQARTLGATWESVSTPFVQLENGRAVAHVGRIELSLVLCGRVVKVGSVHAVATHPNHRRRGHYRRLMDEVLDDSADRYATLILSTENPEYYEPFGFRVVQEHCFVLADSRSHGAAGLRTLDTQDAKDIALLQRLLRTREPVSDVVGVVDETAVFCFNEGNRPLQYAEDLDVLLCMEREGTRLKLFDLVGPRLPALEAVLERIPGRIDEVTLHFAPDRVAAKAVATPYVLDHDGPSYLMVRGPFPAEHDAFTLPRSART